MKIRVFVLALISNPFDRYLRYEASIENAETQQVQYTSSCPVGPGLKSFETWPYPIIQLAMTKIRLLRQDTAEGTIGLAC